MLKQGINDLINNITELSEKYLQLDTNSVRVAYDSLINIIETNPPPELRLTTIPNRPTLTREIVEQEVKKQLALEKEQAQVKRKSEVDTSLNAAKKRILDSVRCFDDVNKFDQKLNKTGNIIITTCADTENKC